MLLHATGELAGERVPLRRKLELLQEHLSLGLGVAHAVDAGRQAQVLRHGEVVEEIRLIGEKCQLAFGLHRRSGEVPPADEDAPGRRPVDAHQAAERGGLARAVGPDEPEDFAGADTERQMADGRDGAV